MKKNNMKFICFPALKKCILRPGNIVLLLILFLLGVGCNPSGDVEYSWQEPQAMVTETGAVLWKPAPFKDDLKG